MNVAESKEFEMVGLMVSNLDSWKVATSVLQTVASRADLSVQLLVVLKVEWMVLMTVDLTVPVKAYVWVDLKDM
jgi:hypothetical protein